MWLHFVIAAAPSDLIDDVKQAGKQDFFFCWALENCYISFDIRTPPSSFDSNNLITAHSFDYYTNMLLSTRKLK